MPKLILLTFAEIYKEEDIAGRIVTDGGLEDHLIHARMDRKNKDLYATNLANLDIKEELIFAGSNVKKVKERLALCAE